MNNVPEIRPQPDDNPKAAARHISARDQACPLLLAPSAPPRFGLNGIAALPLTRKHVCDSCRFLPILGGMSAVAQRLNRSIDVGLSRFAWSKVCPLPAIADQLAFLAGGKIPIKSMAAIQLLSSARSNQSMDARTCGDNLFAFGDFRLRMRHWLPRPPTNTSAKTFPPLIWGD